MQKRSSKNIDKSIDAAEPIGIVISRGSRIEEAPRFAAYVWGPVPDDPGGAHDSELVAVA